MMGIKAFYARKRVSSKRYRNTSADASVHNLCRLLDNVRCTLSKGISVCGLEPSSSLDDSQASQLKPADEDAEMQALPRRGVKRQRLWCGSRKRAILRRKKKVWVAQAPAAASMLDAWSDLELSQRTEVCATEAITAEFIGSVGRRERSPVSCVQ